MEDQTADAEAKILEISGLMTDEPQRALALLLPLAHAGYSSAQFNVGFILESSSHRQPPDQNFDDWLAGVSRSQRQEWAREDEPQAFYWYVQAADRGDPEAVFRAKWLANRLGLDALPWKDAQGRRRELLDLAEGYGANMTMFLYRDVLNGMTAREYLEKYMSKPQHPSPMPSRDAVQSLEGTLDPAADDSQL